MTEAPLKSDEVLALAEEILADCELDRCSVDTIVLKASRLAMLVNDEENMNWLFHERLGYQAKDDFSRKYMRLTGRWTDEKKDEGIYSSIADVINLQKVVNGEIDAIASWQPAGDFSLLQLEKKQNKLRETEKQRMILDRIVWRVRVFLQNFSWQILQEKRFSGESQTVFEKFRDDVDGLLAKRTTSVADKIPHIFERLRKGDTESISHALLTCRRIVTSFTDSVFPPATGTIDIRGKQVEVGPQQIKNRLKAYVDARASSKSQKDKLFKNIVILWDRLSAGVHSDVSPEEAKALILQTYVYLGEIISLGDVPPMHEKA